MDYILVIDTLDDAGHRSSTIALSNFLCFVRGSAGKSTTINFCARSIFARGSYTELRDHMNEGGSTTHKYYASALPNKSIIP